MDIKNVFAYFIEEEDSNNVISNIQLIKAESEKDCLWNIFTAHIGAFEKIFRNNYFKGENYADYTEKPELTLTLRNILTKRGFYFVENPHSINLKEWDNLELEILKAYFFDQLEYAWSHYTKFVPDVQNHKFDNGIAFQHFTIRFKRFEQ